MSGKRAPSIADLSDGAVATFRGVCSRNHRVTAFRSARCALGLTRAAGLTMAILIWATQSWAAIQVSPISANLDTENNRTHVITVINVGDDAVPIKLSAFTWNLTESGRDERRPTDDLILYPSQIILEPGERRAVRVAPRNPMKSTVERSYRIVIREVPVDLDGEDPVTTGVTLLTSYATAFYLTPKNPESALVLESVTRSGEGLLFKLANRGNAHTHLRKLNLVFTQDGREVRIDRPDHLPHFLSENVLAYHERHFSWRWPQELPADIDLTQPFGVKLELECENCGGDQAVLSYTLR